MPTRTTKKNPDASGFKATVFSTAQLEFPVMDRSELLATGHASADGYVSKLRLDERGNLIARVVCGSTAIVCKKKDIPVVIEFLQKIVADK